MVLVHNRCTVHCHVRKIDIIAVVVNLPVDGLGIEERTPPDMFFRVGVVVAFAYLGTCTRRGVGEADRVACLDRRTGGIAVDYQ